MRSAWWLVAVACGSPEPDDLASTGLYAGALGGPVAEDVEAYEPQFPLWSDGAEKSRWVRLPGPIDTTDPDGWIYPEGTQLWKEFRKDGLRVETRMLHKVDGRWTRTTYLWNAAQTAATRITGREPDALGTAHDVPSRGQCLDCHGAVADTVLGFSAIQLAHDGPGLTLTSLAEDGRLTAPLGPIELPGDELDQAALGYLHGNCGMCHRPDAPAGVPDLELWLSVHDLGDVQQTAAWRTGVGVEQRRGEVGGATQRIAPGDPSDSVLLQRMGTRDGDQMPPLGTEEVDAAALETLEAWIEGL